MSRGFVKEDDLEHAGTNLPEKPISPHANYVTPTGFAELTSQASELDQKRAQLLRQKDDPVAKQALAEIDRQLRYLSARIKDAQLVQPSGQDHSKALFGATVTVEDEEGSHHTFTIVGEDEADLSQNKVSYVSPIARALTGKQVGEIAMWQRPAGTLEIEILTITYS